jgi:hypothetical protein
VKPEYGRDLLTAEEPVQIKVPVLARGEELPLKRVVPDGVADGHGEKQDQDAPQPSGCDLRGCKF